VKRLIDARALASPLSHWGREKKVASWHKTCTFFHARSLNRFRATSSNLTSHVSVPYPGLVKCHRRLAEIDQVDGIKLGYGKELIHLLNVPTSATTDIDPDKWLVRVRYLHLSQVGCAEA
jgi:hypothetical protein